MRNDFLSKLSKNELEELLEYLKDYDISYRDTLRLADNLTFGFEIEGEGISKENLELLLAGKSWEVKSDASVLNGAEAASPVFNDTNAAWKEIFEICQLLKTNNMIATENTGGHIHFGNIGLIDSDPQKLISIAKFWSVYESIIYRFSAGEFPKIRKNAFEGKDNNFAEPIAMHICNEKKVLSMLTTSYSKALDYLFLGRKKGLNFQNLYDYYEATTWKKEYYKSFKNLKDTIEVRTPNGTINPVIWQNNINFFSKFLLCGASGNYDIQKINYIIDNLEFTYKAIDGVVRNLVYYNYLNENIPLALELADTIFDNNTDKFNFLKQYINSSNQFVKRKNLR